MWRKIEPKARAALGLAAAWALGAGCCASAAEVKALAIMLPEEPTDFGWNQQAFEAAKAVAAKYHLKFMPASGLGYGDVHAELRELADDGASLIIAHALGSAAHPLPRGLRIGASASLIVFDDRMTHAAPIGQ